jgi:hypothetical protein
MSMPHDLASMRAVVEGITAPARMAATTLPKIPDIAHLIAEEKNVAKRMCRVLAEDIVAFEKELKPDEEVGGYLIGAPDGSVFHIAGISWRSREVISFSGRTPEGRPVRVVQHVSQVRLMLVALSVTCEARRIGFVLMQKLGGD